MVAFAGGLHNSQLWQPRSVPRQGFFLDGAFSFGAQRALAAARACSLVRALDLPVPALPPFCERRSGPGYPQRGHGVGFLVGMVIILLADEAAGGKPVEGFLYGHALGFCLEHFLDVLLHLRWGMVADFADDVL